jgi:DNA polymerase
VCCWNKAFEHTLLSKVWGIEPKDWDDAMVWALYAGLPAGLKDCNRVPFFAQDAQTSKESLLINKFCKPQKNGAVRNRETDPEDWQNFCDYCCDDVADTRLIRNWISKRFVLPERVLRAWQIDQAINQRGMPVDVPFVEAAQREAERLQIINTEQLKELTGLANPNSPPQFLKWLKERGYPFDSLGKDFVKKALATAASDDVEDAEETE